MFFNSYAFVIFLPIALAGAALLRGWALKLWLISLSYIFYGWAEPVYVLLLVASTVLDYTAAQGIQNAGDRVGRKRLWLLASICGNLGLLGFFKYADFGLRTVNAVTGLEYELLNLYLPAGISFYTFQTMSYTLDVYRGKMTPTRSFLTMALYVSFFPQLVAGPIERARDLMPQLHQRQKRDPQDVLAGITRILWGLMKKVVFADWLGHFTSQVFTFPHAFTAWDTALAITCFAFVIYLDFSAYSDIAIGSARCMGIRLRENFKHPYLSRNISEFWRRWHISLSEWLRDYLYFPLGGSRRGVPRTFANVGIVMFLGGLWHGADWAFVLWGLWHGLGLIVFHAWSLLRVKWFGESKRPEGREGFPAFRLWDLPAIALTFAFVWVSWVLFASGGIDKADVMFRKLFTKPWGEFAMRWPTEDMARISAFLAVAILAHLVRGLGWTDRLNKVRQPAVVGAFWGLLIVLIALLFAPASTRFIYFQF